MNAESEPAVPDGAALPARTAAYREIGAVLGLVAVCAAAVLVISGRGWQTIVIARPRPLSDDVLAVTGRTLHPAVSGLAVVALAAVVAILAAGTRVRQVIGAVLVVAGAVLAWQGLAATAQVSRARAVDLVTSAHSGVGVDTDAVSIRIVVHAGWPIGVALAGFGIAVAGALVLWRAPRWATMSRRYEAPQGGDTPAPPPGPDARTSDGGGPVVGAAPADAERARAAHDLALWNSLDRGEDPTV